MKHHENLFDGHGTGTFFDINCIVSAGHNMVGKRKSGEYSLYEKVLYKLPSEDSF